MYRYSREEFSQKLIEIGSIRVGTLHDFRRTEHKAGIADPQEGKKLVTHHIPFAVMDNHDSFHGRAAKEFRAFDLEGSGPGNIFVNCGMGRQFDESDCFILCFSSRKSKDVMSEFEGANSCVKITDHKSFLKQVTNSLMAHTPVNFCGFYKVKYGPRKEAWNGSNWGANPAVIKEIEFSNQFEYRAIWQPSFSQTISPLIIENEHLTEFCQMVNISTL